MDFKIARQGSAVIVKIIKFTIMSQKHLTFISEELVSYCNFMAKLAKKFSFDGGCA
jgi:hypothetical protein